MLKAFCIFGYYRKLAANDEHRGLKLTNKFIQSSRRKLFIAQLSKPVDESVDNF